MGVCERVRCGSMAAFDVKFCCRDGVDASAASEFARPRLLA
jgi:hypothetical protein